MVNSNKERKTNTREPQLECEHAKCSLVVTQWHKIRLRPSNYVTFINESHGRDYGVDHGLKNVSIMYKLLVGIAGPSKESRGSGSWGTLTFNLSELQLSYHKMAATRISDKRKNQTPKQPPVAILKRRKEIHQPHNFSFSSHPWSRLVPPSPEGGRRE